MNEQVAHTQENIRRDLQQTTREEDNHTGKHRHWGRRIMRKAILASHGDRWW